MIDKLSAAVTNKGTRKKRQREINRDETRTSRVGSLTRQKSGYSARTKGLRSRRTARGPYGQQVVAACAGEQPARVYRIPLSLSIFQGATDYLVTDGPFAYPLNLWLFERDARGPEPIQRSISSSLLDSPMLLTLSSLPPVRPFGISLSDPRWFLLSPLRVFSHLLLSFSCNRYTFMGFFRGNCSFCFFSSVLSYRRLSARFILVLISEQSIHFFLFLSINYFWRAIFTFFSCLSLSYVATTDAVLFRDQR